MLFLKGDSTTNDVTDLDDWEDWDAELGIDTEPKEAQILPSLMNVILVLLILLLNFFFFF